MQTVLKDYAIMFVPSKSNEYRPVCQAHYVDVVCKKFSQLFDGYTLTDSTGGYVDSRGILVEENVKQIKSFMPAITSSIELELFTLADKLKEEMNQECIALEISGSLYFI